MRTYMRAALMLCISLCFLFFFKHRCELNDSQETISIIPYECSYNLQSFRLKESDRNWTLSSVSEYDSKGNLLIQRKYYLDSNGRSYYKNGSAKQYVPYMLRRGLNDNINYLSNFQLSEEHFDDYNRVIFRKGIHPSILEHREIAEWYYCPNTKTCNAYTLSAFVRIISAMSTDGIEPVCYGENGEPLLEYNVYEITVYDKYGNETQIKAEGLCFLKNDNTGYLEEIVEESTTTYRVIQVDSSGRPLRSTIYSKENLQMESFTVFEYREL